MSPQRIQASVESSAPSSPNKTKSLFGQPVSNKLIVPLGKTRDKTLTLNQVSPF